MFFIGAIALACPLCYCTYMEQDPLQKDFPVSWEELHRTAKALAWRLLEKGPWKGVVAITRGGLVPACIIARELDVLMVETLCISSYNHKTQSTEGAVVLKTPSTIESSGKGWLVIDDLADTGMTFKVAREILPEAHYACLYVKPEGVPQVDSYVTELSQDTWIHFPWDLENRYAAPMARQGRVQT